MPKTKRQFQVEIETKLLVDAFDAASARKKVEKVLAAQRLIGVDVSTAGEGWTYEATQVEPG
jgi:hypothetical protein